MEPVSIPCLAGQGGRCLEPFSFDGLCPLLIPYTVRNIICSPLSFSPIITAELTISLLSL